jgi:flagellar protein FliO/FliZ
MEYAALARVAFALFTVLGMIALAAFVAKKAGLARSAAALAGRKRLALVESLALDARRRAVILRCDGRDHLVILGPSGETLLASGAAETADPQQSLSPAPSLALALARLGALGGANPFDRKRGAEEEDDAGRKVA